MAKNPTHIIFTLNTTDALNLAIRGLVQPGDHAITTWLDHNSVLRPFNALEHQQIGFEQTRVPCDPHTGLVDPDDIQRAIQPRTKLIAVVHGSNVTGTLQPIWADRPDRQTTRHPAAWSTPPRRWATSRSTCKPT